MKTLSSNAQEDKREEGKHVQIEKFCLLLFVHEIYMATHLTNVCPGGVQ